MNLYNENITAFNNYANCEAIKIRSNVLKYYNEKWE